ncbi:hypothetical protein [Sphingorhabdus sp. Alg239-R122]|uniref:hypothetical protein n=1 Tax=Sphingorhabdus sp. Alg239-R122 TaxID=2305989 RepID=UPI0013DCFBE7|nr:hypothetical protein [Sphingorhabdus sp. Alg239-R122]
MFERVAWGILALIHLSPAAAFFLPSLITKLYGISSGSDTFILLHHRAALFLVVFIGCIWAIFDPDVRRLAVVGTALSMLGFLAIYIMGGQPDALRSIAIADSIGLPFLAYVAWLAFRH